MKTAAEAEHELAEAVVRLEDCKAAISDTAAEYGPEDREPEFPFLLRERTTARTQYYAAYHAYLAARLNELKHSRKDSARTSSLLSRVVAALTCWRSRINGKANDR